MNKPKLWKYKSGKKKGRLRPKAKKYLSKKLKDYWKSNVGILRKAGIKKKRKIPKRRIRRQLCWNSKYNLSLRAFTIDTPTTEEELRITIVEILESNPNLKRIPFETEGYEEEELDKHEDSTLKKGITYIELNARGHITFLRL